MEVLAFKSTTEEARDKDWPDLQIHFIEIMPNNILMDIFNYAEEVSFHVKIKIKCATFSTFTFSCKDER